MSKYYIYSYMYTYVIIYTYIYMYLCMCKNVYIYIAFASTHMSLHSATAAHPLEERIPQHRSKALLLAASPEWNWNF